jgi:predicted phosphodiesterase
MNVLALYDIHGNVDALEAVLADPRAAGPDAVVVGGDAVPGPFARATLDRLAALDAPVHWVRGNGEREVGAALDAPTDPPPDPEDLVLVTAARSAAEIGDDDARRLAALPLTLGLDGVLYCHATPRDDEELLTRISTPERWAAALQGVQEPLVVAGHTHQQDDRTVGATRFVNAGSVGLPYEGDGAARWLWVADGVPDLRTTSYDNLGAGARILASGWPDAASTGAALTEPVDAMSVTELFEERARA